MAKVLSFPPNFYAATRARLLASCVLHDGNGSRVPSEKLLQLIWYYQRILRDQLKTLDGRTVRVLHPGFWNREAGPDFRGAIVQFGTEHPQSGDIEVDLQGQGWRTHGHERNPNYSRVILHVVWDGADHFESSLPVLALDKLLDSSLEELEGTLGVEILSLPDPALGQCSSPLQGMGEEAVQEMLRQAGRLRLQDKAAQLQARARQAGWEPAFWESMLAALGYKHNSWAMRRMGEILPKIEKGEPDETLSVGQLQARLLGVSGLLPEKAYASGTAYLRGLWDIWWRERARFAELILPRELWRLHGLRPANHPQRRLVLCSHWLTQGDLIQKIESWFVRSIPDQDLLPSLLETLQVEMDPFWSFHWSFRSKGFKKPQPLLGAQRATDLAMNVILPWLWVRAVAGKNAGLQAVAEHRYFTWPPGEDNSVLRLARRRLFGSKNVGLASAAYQQGLLQIVRDFCHYSNALCADCGFPQLLLSLES